MVTERELEKKRRKRRLCRMVFLTVVSVFALRRIGKGRRKKREISE